jgi:hypothetical protein
MEDGIQLAHPAYLSEAKEMVAAVYRSKASNRDRVTEMPLV